MNHESQLQRLVLWERYKNAGHQFSVAESLHFVQQCFFFGLLSSANKEAQTLLPVVIGEPPSSITDWRIWASDVCVLLRVIYLADTSERALDWWERAYGIAETNSAPDEAIDVLMYERSYQLFSTGEQEKQTMAAQGILMLVDIDFLRWTDLVRQGDYDLTLLSDLSVRICDSCFFALTLRSDVPLRIVDRAKGLYRIIKGERPWQKLPDDSPEAWFLNFATRHLATALAYSQAPELDRADLQEVGAPYIDLDLAYLDFQSARTDEDGIVFAWRFLDSYRNWRHMIPAYDVRTALRQRMSLLATPFLKHLRGQSETNWPLISESEEILGPSRWLEERLAEIAQPADGVPQILPSNAKVGTNVFGDRGGILQLIPSHDDLLYVWQEFDGQLALPNTFQGGEIENGKLELRQIHAKYFGSEGRIATVNARLEKLKDIRQKYDASWNDSHGKEIQPEVKKRLMDEYFTALEDLDAATDEAATAMGEVVSPVFKFLSDSLDVLLVCTDPTLLCLPWSLARNDDQTIIQQIRSLTVTASIGASDCLAKIARDRPQYHPLSVAAYCDCTQGLQWEEIFKDPMELELRTFGVRGRNTTPISVQRLQSYPDEEADVLLIAGHGHPEKGVRLGTNHWHPQFDADSWRLNRTQCAIIPSCRLGELLWDAQAQSNRIDAQIDPSKYQITGFLAHLCLARIPRVLACPWIAYDKPVSHLISKVIRRAMILRHENQQHIWARALRDTVVAELENPGTVGPYDLANLILFGAP